MAYAVTLDMESSRRPTRRDYLLFYLGLPLLYALWLTGSGIRFVSYMSFWNGFIYMSVYCLITWWATDLGCRLARYLLRNRQLPLWTVLVIGFLLNLVPLGYIYTQSADLLIRYYPELAPFTSDRDFNWTFEYALHYFRYSLPWLATWFVVIYGYRFFFGVSWYETPAAAACPEEKPLTEPVLADKIFVPPFLAQSRLSADARIYAINAAEHYIRVWSDQGTDMIRYRFRDALRDMNSAHGMRVHRSWWIDHSRVTRQRAKGRSMHVTVADQLEVPVSLAYREKLTAALPERDTI